ncbi:hypothetical protein [Ponticoccus alexandrii]|uniref:Conjugal transfer protein TraD n=1 Tax=Ponticoccus alexandrii TaxID=1943633 RepID=A0ABX7F4S6_9RHOB|nr:hypothetical protein [Ponticoccus alexandrii]ETA49670.1 hypothetical protein P279_23565 [Rhodobacteraceae bacterium PD-2]QRF65535.1 hypothetical protein GQA70_03900 [Ponticoccus alexandrii]
MRNSLLARSTTSRAARLKKLNTRLKHARLRLAILKGGDLQANSNQDMLYLVGALVGPHSQADEAGTSCPRSASPPLGALLRTAVPARDDHRFRVF